MRLAHRAGCLSLVLAVLAVAACGETVITRDSTKPGCPIVSAEFRLTPKSEAARERVRELTARITPDRTKGNAGVYFTAWGECSFEISLPGAGVEAKELSVDGHSGLWWDGDNRTRMQFYERNDGGLEWEICLDSQPSSNQLQFPIAIEGLVFCYQGELTEEENAEGARRPDSVIGSYAVYHAVRRDNLSVIRGEDTLHEMYGTGKAFHIYRPKAHDTNGMTVWCDLRIDSTFIISVPPDFLQAAVYPVTIDPTFGYTSAGGTQTIPGTARANINDAHTHPAGSGENITSLSVYASSGSGTQSLGLAAYSMDNGSPRLPVTRLATAATVSLAGVTPTWYTTSTVSQSLASGTRYCVALGDGNAYTNIYYDSYGSTARSNNTTAALPATWANNGTGTVVYSMYATYTVSGMATPPSRRRRISLAEIPSEQRGRELDETEQTLAGRFDTPRGAPAERGRQCDSHSE